MLAMPPESTEHHQRVEQQQRQRGQEDRPAQVERLAVAIDVEPGIEPREIERRRPVIGRERIDRDQAFRRPVESGRMIGAGAAR